LAPPLLCTVNNLLSQAAADADVMASTIGRNTLPELIRRCKIESASCNRSAAAQQHQDGVIRWPSVAGKSYVIERSANLFSPAWSPFQPTRGTGGDMEFHDLSGGNVRFYRVRVQ